MSKVLVTGGAGFIGSHTVVELVNAGFTPLIIDDFSNSDERVIAGMEKILGSSVNLHRENCADVEALRKIFTKEKISSVIHFAASKAVGESVQQPLKYYRNNLLSTLALLEVMKEFEVTQLVFSSSCTVYGQPDQLPVTENTPWKKANSPYGYTKQVSEQMIADFFHSSKNFSSTILRYFNPIGAHPSGFIGELPFGIPNNLVPFITQTAAGLRNELVVYGNDYNTPDGSCIRDFIHVVDLARAHVSALRWIEKNPARCEVFNLGQGHGHSVLEVINSFIETTGQKFSWRIGARREGDVEKIWADASKANQALGWKTEMSLKDALRDAWAWQENLSVN